MLYYFLTITFCLSSKLTLAKTDSGLVSEFPHFFRNIEPSPEKPLLDSIVKLFVDQGRVYCIVLIHDEIDIKSNSLSKFESVVTYQMTDFKTIKN